MSAPEPQQRADYLVRRLEEFIREGKGSQGLRFKTWQALARAEIANAFAEVERLQDRAHQDVAGKRVAAALAAALVTIGFWGAVLAMDRGHGVVAAIALIVAGLILLVLAYEIGFQRVMARGRRRRRAKLFSQIDEFDVQLRRLEADIKRRLDRTRREVEEREP